MVSLVLVTRPLEQAGEFAKAVMDCGAEALICPMLKIVPRFFDPESFHLPDAVIVTSGQVFSCGADFSRVFHLPLYCVGAVTSDKARYAGFLDVRPFSQDVTTLLENLTHDVPFGSRLLYLRGRDVRIDLEAVLPQYSLDQKIIYQADPVGELSPEIIRIFPEIHTVALFSARSGVVFARHMLQYGFQNMMGGVNLLSLSSVVQESVSEFEWRSCVIAPQPDMLSMVCALTTLLQEKK